MKNKNKKDKISRNRKSGKAWIVLLLLLLIGGVITICVTRKEPLKKTDENTESYGPHFTKNGELVFLGSKNSDTLTKIDIEIADNEPKRIQGLMYRHSMADSVGMLFIFDNEEPQSFWMKNTYIPLDIIFINNSYEIVTIRDNNTPLKEWPIDSEKPAKYVVEVTGGFCYAHNIKVGDKIDFKRTN